MIAGSDNRMMLIKKEILLRLDMELKLCDNFVSKINPIIVVIKLIPVKNR
jgi:hypothetical protein